jgi:hypothetical protein
MDAPKVTVAPADGRAGSPGGMAVALRVSSADAGGPFAIVEQPIEAGWLVFPQAHAHKDA